MFEIIAVFFPNFIGTAMVDKKRKFNYKEYLLCYSIITVIVNTIMYLTCYLTNKDFAFNDFMFFLEYVLISVLLNIIFGLFIRWIISRYTIIIRRK